jgi:ABC-type transporter Mla subunit MlaD
MKINKNKFLLLLGLTLTNTIIFSTNQPEVTPKDTPTVNPNTKTEENRREKIDSNIKLLPPLVQAMNSEITQAKELKNDLDNNKKTLEQLEQANPKNQTEIDNTKASINTINDNIKKTKRGITEQSNKIKDILDEIKTLLPKGQSFITENYEYLEEKVGSTGAVITSGAVLALLGFGIYKACAYLFASNEEDYNEEDNN